MSGPEHGGENGGGDRFDANLLTKKISAKSFKLEMDYSHLQFSGNKSFMEAWDEASKANEEVARFANKELSSLRALKMIHTLSLFYYLM